jgi:hypothetical protein
MRDDLLRLDLDFTLEGRVYHARPSLLRSSQILMQVVDQPTQEFDRVAPFCNLKLAHAPLRHLLQELVRTDLSLEQSRVP